MVDKFHFRINIKGKWKTVSLPKEEVDRMKKNAIRDYVDLVEQIKSELDSRDFKKFEKIDILLAVFDKVASPLHYKIKNAIRDR